MANSKSTAASDQTSQASEGVDLLLVSIGGKEVFIRSSEIKEILRPKALTSVPMGPEHLLGMANIHGQIVCIIDAGGVTSLPPCNRAVTPRTRFLLLRHAVMHVGIWVDEVSKIQQVTDSILANATNNGESIHRIEVEGTTCELLQCKELLH